jgi:hypothetical protein
MGLLAKHWRLLHRPVGEASLAAWMRRYLTWLAAARPSVYDHHRNALANFLDWCEEIGVESAAAITRAQIDAWQGDLAAQPTQPIHRQQQRQVIAAWLRWLVTQGALAADPLTEALHAQPRALLAAIVRLVEVRAGELGLAPAAMRVTRREIAAVWGREPKQMHDHLRTLVDAGYLAEHATAHGQILSYALSATP